jgi:hypothetical protein
MCLPPGPTAAAAIISISSRLLNQQPFRRHRPDGSRSQKAKKMGWKANARPTTSVKKWPWLISRTSFETRPCWLARSASRFPGDATLKRRHLTSLARLAERNKIISRQEKRDLNVVTARPKAFRRQRCRRGAYGIQTATIPHRRSRTCAQRYNFGPRDRYLSIECASRVRFMAACSVGKSKDQVVGL